MDSNDGSTAAIDACYLKGQLERLLAVPSPCGMTEEAVACVGGELDRLGLPYRLSRQGALIARMPGREKGEARAVVAHLDTLGAQVKALKPNGRLELLPVGTWSARFAEGARATVFSETARHRGTILPLKASGHAYNEEVDSLPIGWQQVELRVDGRVGSAGDLAAVGIEVGDLVAIDPQPEFLDNGFIISRHLDDKAGAAAMLAAIRALAGTVPPRDVHWIFSVREEVGLGAAAVLSAGIAEMVAVDIGIAAPGQNASEFGVTLGMGDQSGPFDVGLSRRLATLCGTNGIACRKDVFRHYFSDAVAALRAGADVRTALVTFGVDASHGYERTHTDALTSVAALLVAYARESSTP